VLYLGGGGAPWSPALGTLPPRYRIYDPQSGELLSEARLDEDSGPVLRTGSREPRVVVFFAPEAEQ
jgi:hypothetical protein